MIVLPLSTSLSWNFIVIGLSGNFSKWANAASFQEQYVCRTINTNRVFIFQLPIAMQHNLQRYHGIMVPYRSELKFLVMSKTLWYLMINSLCALLSSEVFPIGLCLCPKLTSFCVSTSGNSRDLHMKHKKNTLTCLIFFLLDLYTWFRHQVKERQGCRYGLGGNIKVTIGWLHQLAMIIIAFFNCWEFVCLESLEHFAPDWTVPASPADPADKLDHN